MIVWATVIRAAIVKLLQKIIIYEIVLKSFAYVAMFIVIMDILKYCFDIDPVHDKRKRMRRKRRAKKPKPPVIQRFVYANRPASSNVPISTVQDTTV